MLTESHHNGKARQRDANRSLETLLHMDKSVASKNGVAPAAGPRKIIPGQGLEFNNLSHSVIKKQKKEGVWIKKETYLLNVISGQAMKCEIMAIMGPSGAGKSTFLDALAGRIVQGSLEGSVIIDGKPVILLPSLNFSTSYTIFLTIVFSFFGLRMVVIYIGWSCRLLQAT